MEDALLGASQRFSEEAKRNETLGSPSSNTKQSKPG
jgi:hypothetical protein